MCSEYKLLDRSTHFSPFLTSYDLLVLEPNPNPQTESPNLHLLPIQTVLPHKLNIIQSNINKNLSAETVQIHKSIPRIRFSTKPRTVGASVNTILARVTL